MDWNADPASDPARLYTDYDPAVAGAAVNTLREARESEQDMTTDVLSAIPADARPHGLAFRMKSPASLARKINTKMRDKQTPPAETAGTVTDLVRYTAVAKDSDRLAPTARATIRSLTKAGWTVTEAEQSYVPDNPYKGLHVLLTSPAGETAEVQFHTEQSQAIKDTHHADFEVSRDYRRPAAEREAADRRMVAAWSVIDRPAGLPKTLGGIPVQKKNYATAANKTQTQKGRNS